VRPRSPARRDSASLGSTRRRSAHARCAGPQPQPSSRSTSAPSDWSSAHRCAARPPAPRSYRGPTRVIGAPASPVLVSSFVPHASTLQYSPARLPRFAGPSIFMLGSVRVCRASAKARRASAFGERPLHLTNVLRGVLHVAVARAARAARVDRGASWERVARPVCAEQSRSEVRRFWRVVVVHTRVRVCAVKACCMAMPPRVLA